MPGWLSAGTAPFADPEVGVVTGATLPADPPPYGPWHATIDIREQTWRFETCNAFFRRRALLESPGFDERLTMWEDTAGGWGVVRAGYRPVFVPEAVVHHDVTYPGLRWHLRRVQRYGQGAAIVGRYPEIRRKVFWHPLFLRRTDAELTAALAGLALARRSRWALLLALPYARRRWPGSPHPKALIGSSKVLAYDLAILAGMARESARWRRLVL
jgi:GT2 family glycosyltransferase